MIMFLFRVQEALKNVFATFATLIRILAMSKWRVAYPKKTTESCVILGNGPSLNQSLATYKDQLKAYTRICVNEFPRSDAFEQTKPQMYILAAKEYWRNDVLDFYYDIRRITFGALVEKTTWDMVVWLPYESRKYKEFINLFAKNPHLKIHYFNMTPVEGFDSLCHRFFRWSWGIPRPHNVVIPALMIALNMQYKEIYLIGAEHSWLPEISVNEKNEALLHQKHFYDEQTSRPNVMYQAGQRPRRLYEILEKFYLTFRAYFIINDYAQTLKTPIYNATPQSFIDAFERKIIP